MSFVNYVLAGILGGILAGMGMGGGTLTMPLLVLVLGVSQLVAQYANLLAFLPSGSIALGMHFSNGLVNTNNMIYLLLPAFATCVVSSIFATRIHAELLKQLFGGFLCIIAIFSLSAKVFERH